MGLLDLNQQHQQLFSHQPNVIRDVEEGKFDSDGNAASLPPQYPASVHSEQSYHS